MKLQAILVIFLIAITNITFSKNNDILIKRVKKESQEFIFNLIHNKDKAMEYMIKVKPFFKGKKKLLLEKIYHNIIILKWGHLDNDFELIGQEYDPPIFNLFYILYGEKKSLVIGILYFRVIVKFSVLNEKN